MAIPNTFPTPSPSISILPSQEYFGNGYYVGQTNGTGQNLNGSSNSLSLTSNAPVLPTPGSLAGRKRSRGNIHEDDEIEPDGSLPTPASEYGSMPNLNAMMDVSDPSHSAMWTQAQMASQPFQLQHTQRPIFGSRKSQRVMAPSGSDDLAQLVLPANMREATTEPLIDEATRMLGISWTRMDSREALQISAAAYAKFVVNHYPALREVTIWFENSAIPCYLGQCLNVYNGHREYYFFSNDLLEARLITRDANDLLMRLQMLHKGIEVAAPGGTIKAEMSPTSYSYCGVSNITQQSALYSSENAALNTAGAEASMPGGSCAAHSMELD